MAAEKLLLEKAHSFDLDSLAEIYDCYSPGVYRYAMRLLGDVILAEDCVADTFSRFLQVLKNGGGPDDALQAYLYRIAHNWITDSYRRQPPPPLDLDEALRASDHLQPEAQLDVRLEQDRIRMALRALTPEQRQVVALRFLEGWENEEVATALQKPVGAIKALQHRALNALRKLLLLKEKEAVYELKE